MIRKFFHIAWFLIQVTAVAVLAVGLLSGMYWYTRVDDAIRAQIEQTLADHYSPLVVTVRSARRIGERGIVVRGISVVDPNRDGGGTQRVWIDEMFMSCQTGIEQLIQRRIDIGQISVRGMTVRATVRDDGSVDFADMFPLPSLGGHLEVGSIKHCNVELIDSRKQTAEQFLLKDVHVGITRDDAVTTGGTRPLVIRAKLASNHFDRMECIVRLDPETWDWSVRGTIAGLGLSPQLREALPLEISDQLEQIGSLQTQADLEFQVDSPTDQEEAWQFDVQGQLSQGQFDDPRLPFPLWDLRAKVHCDNAGVRVESLEAQNGSVKLKLSGKRDGYSAHSPTQITLHADNLRLDRRVADLLPLSVREKWLDYQPAGVVNTTVRLVHDGREWKVELDVQYVNVSFTCPNFPYRVHGGHGKLSLKRDRLQVDVVALASGQAVRFQADLERPLHNPHGWVEVNSNGPIPINDALMNALKDETKWVVQSLDPRGAILFTWRLDYDGNPQTVDRQRGIITLDHCSIRPDHFPYPLHGVRGTLEIDGKQLWIRDLEGRNDSGIVQCEGNWTNRPSGPELNLKLVGTNISLEDELHNALPPAARRAWEGLRPSGTMDQISIHIRHVPSDKETSLSVVAQKQSGVRRADRGAISIHPTWFPYRMEHCTGQVEYVDGQIRLKDLRATHGPVRFAASGGWSVDKKNRWTLLLEDLTIDRLQADRELVSALPDRMAEAVRKLKLTGPVNVRGMLQVDGLSDHDTKSNWDLEFDLAGSGIDSMIQLDHVHGGVRLVGSYDGQGVRCRGDLAIDSLIHRGVQFTQFRGPIMIDDQRLMLGSWAKDAQSERRPKQLTANVVGGTVYGDGQVVWGEPSQFWINATLTEGDLARASRGAGLRNQGISGKAFGAIRLMGTEAGTHTLRGIGIVRLRDADIYELPLMVSLLKILSPRAPDRTAFTTSDINFRVEADQVYFDRIDFKGDAVSLIGNGEMNLDHELNLNFYAMVGRGDLNIPLIRPILGEASRQFMMIRVTGNFQDPETTRDAFPGLNETFQQLFPEAARRDEGVDAKNWNLRAMLERTGVVPRR